MSKKQDANAMRIASAISNLSTSKVTSETKQDTPIPVPTQEKKQATSPEVTSQATSHDATSQATSPEKSLLSDFAVKKASRVFDIAEKMSTAELAVRVARFKCTDGYEVDFSHVLIGDRVPCSELRKFFMSIKVGSSLLSHDASHKWYGNKNVFGLPLEKSDHNVDNMYTIFHKKLFINHDGVPYAYTGEKGMGYFIRQGTCKNLKYIGK